MSSRGNKAPTIDQNDIPDLGDPDRKRMLNVIAQRRYRQRQREKLNRTASRNESASISSLSSTTFGTTTSDIGHETSNMPTVALSPTVDNLFLHPFDLIGTGNPIGLRSSNSFLSLPAVLPDHLFTDFSTELSDLEIAQFTFSDTPCLDIPILKLFNVGMIIAGLLDCVDTVWNPTFTRIVTASQFSESDLPPNLVPTPIQGQIPHHPVLDVLPWPSVRAKLIAVFAQPVHLRPPIARDETSVMRLLQDIDDESDGVRIGNSQGNDADALSERAWEIGQAFYRNWWWALNTDIVENSNKLRRDRGARPLTLMT